MKRVLLTILILSACALPGCSKNSSTQSAAAAPKPKIIEVAAAKVRIEEVPRNVESVGTLLAYEEVTVSSEVEGRVEQIHADVGDYVTRGQPLVSVVPEELKYLLSQQEAALHQALNKLGLKDENSELKDDTEVPEVRKAQADLYDAEQKYKRAQFLFQTQVASQQELDEAKARYDAARANYDVTLHQVQNLKSLVRQYKASVALARKKLRDTQILAPFSGSIKERLVSVGQYLRVQTPVYSLVNTNPLRLKTDIPEKMAPWVRVGQEVQITVEAYPGQVFRGKVSRISPAVDEQKRTFMVEALFNNDQKLLRPGFYAKVSIATDKKDRVLLVPASSVLYTYGTNKVFIINGGKVNARDVKLGDRFGSNFEILEGVNPEEEIAVSDLEKLENGTQVSVAAK